MINNQTLSCGHPIQAASEMLPDFFGDTPATQKIGTVYCRWCDDVARAEARVKELEKWRDAVLSIVDSLDDPYGDSWNETSQEDCAGELEHIRSVLVPLVGIVFNKFLWIFWIWNKSWYRIRNRGGEMSALVCEHGSLRRKCEICERDGRIKELEARVKELEETLRSLLLIFQTAQGKAIHAAERALCGEGPCKNE